MNAIIFGGFGLLIVVVGLFIAFRFQRWFNRMLSPSAAFVYVLAESFAFYCIAVGVRLAISYRFELMESPAFLIIPAAAALAATAQIIEQRRVKE
jgi:hypothetical protein